MYGFSDENMPEEDYIGIGKRPIGRPLCTNTTEPLRIIFLNLNPFFFNARMYLLDNFSYTILDKKLFSHTDNKTNINIQDKIDSFNAFKLYGGLVLMLSGYFENNENKRSYAYLEEQWNKTINEELLNIRIIRK
jgi:hypothetical protein